MFFDRDTMAVFIQEYHADLFEVRKLSDRQLVKAIDDTPLKDLPHVRVLLDRFETKEQGE